MALAAVVGVALIFVAWPAWGSPWDFAVAMVPWALAVAAPLIVTVLAGLAAGAILGVVDRRPG